MMIYCSLQVKFERTKPNGRIQRYGASIFGDIIIKVSKSINKEQQVFWRLQYIARFDVRECTWISQVVQLLENKGLFVEVLINAAFVWHHRW